MRAKIRFAAATLATLASLSTPPTQAQEDIRYVRDWLSIPLRESTSPDSGVVHKGVISGTRLQVLQSDAGSGTVRVRTEDGKEGWLRANYLAKEPGARAQLEQYRTEINQLKKLNEQLRAGAPSVGLLQDRLKREDAEAQAQIAKLNQEIDTLRGRIGDNSKLVQDHAALSQHAEQLQAEVARLKTEVTELSSGSQQAYFRDGAIAVGAGALLTLLAANFWPRKKRSDWA
jgi:SH3 domain protein